MTIRIEPLLLCPMCESFNAYGIVGQRIIWKTCSACQALRRCGKTGSDRGDRWSRKHIHDDMFEKLFGKDVS